MQQLNIFGKTKEEEAVEFIIEHRPKDKPWFVGISGGKDSTVLYHLCKLSGVECEYYYSATGIDPPEITNHIKRNMPDVIFKRPPKAFYHDILIKGFPTKKTRWCCDTLKKFATADIDLSDRLMGIRREESSRRSKRPQIDRYKNGDNVFKPIFYWLEWEIWEFIERHNLPYCSLYEEGFSRIGCVVCPFICNPKPKTVPWILEKHKKRWPGIYRAFENAMYNLYINGDLPSMRKLRMNNLWRTSLKYLEPITWDIFINNWYSGKNNFYVKD